MTHITIELDVPPTQCEFGVPIQQLTAERDADPRKAAAMARARMRHASTLATAAEFSLAALRLSKGLSQSKLAELMGKQQPYIARIERGDDDLKTSTIEQLAMALGVTEAEVFQAIQATRNKRNTTL